MPTTGLIDGDILAYQVSSIIQEEYDFEDGEGTTTIVDLEHGREEIDRRIQYLIGDLFLDDVIICLSCREHNFRKDILPSYKEQREALARPQALMDMRTYLTENYRTYLRYSLEGDDIMGILATSPHIVPGEKIIISIDKDMKTVPCTLWDGKTMETYSEAEADYWFLFQTLTGDTIDNFKGCPGVGPVKAEKLLQEGGSWPPFGTIEECWAKVVAPAFEARGLTEEDALVQARCARILRAEDYDFHKKEPILWQPNS